MNFDSLGITTDDQLREIAKKMGLPPIQYIGFAEDMQTLPDGLSIINLGGYQGGTHWTLLYVAPGGVYYYDSYGVGPEDNILRLSNDRGLDVYYNNKQVQRYEEEHCGIWALLAAKAIVEGKVGDEKKSLERFSNKFNSV